MLEIRTHGRGGQGVVTYGDVLAQAGLNAGFQVQTLPFFGVERRGASIRALLRLSKEEIKKRSQCYNPDILVLFNDNQLEEARSIGNCDKAVIVFNSPNREHPVDEYWVVDAEAIAYEYSLTHGDDVFINIVMAGALAKVLRLSEKDLTEAIKTIRGVKDDDPNIKAALKAYSVITKVGGDD